MMQAVEHEELPGRPWDRQREPENFDTNECGPQSETPPELPEDEDDE